MDMRKWASAKPSSSHSWNKSLALKGKPNIVQKRATDKCSLIPNSYHTGNLKLVFKLVEFSGVQGGIF